MDSLRRPDDVSLQQWNAYLRRRARLPLFADDPDLVLPPRTRAEQEGYRRALRQDAQRRERTRRARARCGRRAGGTGSYETHAWMQRRSGLRCESGGNTTWAKNTWPTHSNTWRVGTG